MSDIGLTKKPTHYRIVCTSCENEVWVPVDDYSGEMWCANCCPEQGYKMEIKKQDPTVTL